MGCVSHTSKSKFAKENPDGLPNSNANPYEPTLNPIMIITLLQTILDLTQTVSLTIHISIMVDVNHGGRL